MKNKSFMGVLILLVTAFIWGVAFVFQRTGMDHIGPISFMAARCFLAVLFLGALLLILRKKDAFKFSKTEIIGGLGCGLFMTIANGFQQVGMVYTTAGKAGFVTAMYILVVPVIKALFLKKKDSKKVWICVLMGLVGMALLCIGPGLEFNIGDLIVFGCALFFSVHIICADGYGKHADAVKLSFIQFVVSFVLNLIVALLFEEMTWEGLYDARIAIMYCGILSAGVGYTLQIIGQKYVEPTAASLIMSLESVFAVLAGWLFLNETMTAKETLGCVIMFAAIVVVQINPKQKTLQNKE